MSVEHIKIPDIGSDSAEVVEILVSVGDEVDADQSLFVLESDKASVEVPCPKAGTIVSLAISVGDKVSEGITALELDVVSTEDEEGLSSVEQAEDTVEVEEISESASAPAEAHAVDELVVCLVPDIGADEAEIIEIAVSIGDSVVEGDSIAVAESDKASLEIPAEFDGQIEALHVTEGAKVSQGEELVTLKRSVSLAQVSDDTDGDAPTAADDTELPVLDDVVPTLDSPIAETYSVPDVGSDAAEVIEVCVAKGDQIAEGDSVCVVETDKASVEVPSPASGTVESLFVSVGDKIAQGNDLIRIQGVAIAKSAQEVTSSESGSKPQKAEQSAIKPATTNTPKPASPASSVSRSSSEVYAGPAVRKHARELGVDLVEVKGTGERGRIVIEDVNQHVKRRMQSGGSTSGGAGVPEIPAVDWSKFGDVDVQPMSRIHKATAANMVRNWLNVPHVTQFDQADVTELEKYRAYLKSEVQARGIKMTPVAFVLKAAAVALTENPKVNSSLHHNGEDIVYRKFCHIGLAVDTPAGLMVPVIRDVDQKDIWEIAADIATLAGKAKEGKLSPNEMQGASFTVSSLGAIGGSGFTPIVPAPQAGILGVSNTSIQPFWDGQNFVPRKMMPLALSYDHRVVNGADAGKFLTELVAILQDLNRIWNG